MKVSTRGRYALRFMADLAEHEAAGFVPLKDISERQGISIKYLEQITARLSKSGLLISIRGPQGGYKLAKKAKNYTGYPLQYFVFPLLSCASAYSVVCRIYTFPHINRITKVRFNKSKKYLQASGI